MPISAYQRINKLSWLRPFFCAGFLTLSVSLSVQAEPQKIEVLAIEYPPYSSQAAPDHGLTFRLLKQRLKQHTDAEIIPLFMPPARLHQRIRRNQWCLSFYPPSSAGVEYWRLTLSEQLIRVGLYHRLTDDINRWKSLEQLQGRKVALLRALQRTEFVARFNHLGIIPVYVDSVKQGINMLLRQRVDAALGDDGLKAYLEEIKGNPVPIIFSDNISKEIEVGVYVNNDCWVAELLEAKPDSLQ